MTKGNTQTCTINYKNFTSVKTGRYWIIPFYHHNKELFLLLDSYNVNWAVLDKKTLNAIEFLISKNIIKEYDKNIEVLNNMPEYKELMYILKREKLLINDDYKEENIEILDVPPYLYIELTFKCPSSCVYCYTKSSNKNIFSSTKKKNFWKKILEDAASLGIKYIVFTGGDPLTRKEDLSELIYYAKKDNNLKVEVLTSGFLLDEEFIDNNLKYIDYIQISIDSTLPKINDLLRGKGSAKKIFNALNILDKKNAFRKVGISITLGKHNLRYLYKSLVDLYNIGIRKFNFNILFRPRFNKKIEKYLLSSDELIYAFYIINDFNKKYKIKYKYTSEYSHRFIRRINCGAGVWQLSISPDGIVYPCHLLEASEFSCGKADKGIKSILKESKILKYFRGNIVDKISICRICPLRYVCGGGCRGIAFHEEGSVLRRCDRLCKFYMYNSLFRLVSEVVDIEYGKVDFYDMRLLY